MYIYENLFKYFHKSKISILSIPSKIFQNLFPEPSQKTKCKDLEAMIVLRDLPVYATLTRSENLHTTYKPFLII